jgi:nickel transport protein
MISSTLFRLLILITLFSLPITANAHKLRVFAWVEGDVIVGETAFSGKRKPKDAEITVQNGANQTVLLTTRTDDLGKFSFAIPEQAVQQQLDLLIVVNAGEGHRGEWPLPVGEYLGKESVQINTTPKIPTPSKTTKQSIQTDHQVLRRIVAEELDKKIRPLNKKLAETQDDKPDMRDILGGIGYILGLAGLLAWLKAKKQKEDQ